jgi:hypothetical protein
MSEPEFQALLLEEQYVARLSQTLQMQFQQTKAIIKQDKYNVQANAQLPKLKEDMKSIVALSASMSQAIVGHLEEKYNLELPFLKPKKETKIVVE